MCTAPCSAWGGGGLSSFIPIYAQFDWANQNQIPRELAAHSSRRRRRGRVFLQGYHILRHELHQYSHDISVRQQFDKVRAQFTPWLLLLLEVQSRLSLASTARGTECDSSHGAEEPSLGLCPECRVRRAWQEC